MVVGPAVVTAEFLVGTAMKGRSATKACSIHIHFFFSKDKLWEQRKKIRKEDLPFLGKIEGKTTFQADDYTFLNVWRLDMTRRLPFLCNHER